MKDELDDILINYLCSKEVQIRSICHLVFAGHDALDDVGKTTREYIRHGGSF